MVESCFPLWFDMLKAATIIPRQGMLSILCFFHWNSVGKLPLSFFFRRGLGVYLVQSVNRSPTLWLQAWVNEYMMFLESWACRPSIRLPWPLMTWIDPVIQSWTFHKLNVKLGGENMLLPHPIFNCAKPAICSVCATDVNDFLNYAPFMHSHHAYIFTWCTIKWTLKSHNRAL